MRIKRMPIVFLIISLTILLLSACGSPANKPSPTSVPADIPIQTRKPENIAPPDNSIDPSSSASTLASELETKDAAPPAANPKDTEPPASEMQASVPATDAQPYVYQKVYAQTVTENTDENTLFSLILLDNDDIPELVVYDSYDLTYSIYTVQGDALFCLADALATVELTYFEQTGILCEFARWNGGGDEGGYGRSYYRTANDRTLSDSDIPELNYVYNAVYDEEGVYTGEGITKYFSMSEEMDEASYERLAENLGIADSEEKACSENALGKEEILTFLSK